MLKKGDAVVMHTCGEAEHYKGRMWTCESDEFTSTSETQVVFLEGFSGYFLVKYLQRVDLTPLTDELNQLETSLKSYKSKNEVYETPVYVEDLMYELSPNEKGEIPVRINIHGVEHVLGVTQNDVRSFNQIFQVQKMLKS